MCKKGIFRNKGVTYKSILQLTIYLILVIISAVFFDSKGPVILTFFGSFVLLVNLSHIRLKPKSFQAISKLPKTSTIISHWGPLIMYHSHHSAEARLKGKEFRIGRKYFCTGCYGGLLGTLIAIFLTGFYLLYGFNQVLAIISILSLPVWFIPIILRYTLFLNMKNIPRFLSNMFLPVGCSILLILTDFTFQSWALNGITIFLIICVAYLRNYASNREEKNLGY
ncbi:hypothetical protein ES705_08714 [subsurface metagenome]